MRKVKEEDFKIFWKEADKKYNLANTYYWYPLIEKPIENTIVSYRTTELLKSRFKETLERNIQELNVLMYLKMEYQIDGSEYYIIESKEFDLDRLLEFGDFNHTKVQWKSPKISSIKKAIIKSNKTL